MSLPTATATAPGWYTDTNDPSQLRFFNGSTWSDHVKARPGLPTDYQTQRQRAYYGSTRRIR